MAAWSQRHLITSRIPSEPLTNQKGSNMAALANITVKKADGTTDVVYTAIVGATGDKTDARWANRTVGTTPAEQPQLSMRSEYNGNSTARRMTVSYKWPMVQQDAGGNTVVRGGMVASATVTIPQNQASAVIKEQAYQFVNLLASTLIKASLDEGVAPR